MQKSIAVVVAAAILVWSAVVLWQQQRGHFAIQRALQDIDATYRCAEGHLFDDKLDTKSHPCQEKQCHARAWPVWTYQCSKHGAYLLNLRYVLDRRRPRLSATQVVGQDWQQVHGELRCPSCERELVPDVSLRPLEMHNVDNPSVIPKTIPHTSESK